MKIELPTKFFIDYSKLPNRKYYNWNNKPLLCNELLSSSQSYCMYCGKSLLNENDSLYHMEHSIDKAGNENQKEEKTFLTHCKFNFSVSCPYCNMVCKKIIEKIDLDKLEDLVNCDEKKCDSMCEEYKKLREQYAKKNAIIIQPQGIFGKKQRLKIYYDLIQNIYKPDNSIEDNEDLFFVHNHIRRFQLNGLRFSESIIDICAEIVVLNEDGISSRDEMFRFLKSRRYPNIIVQKFINYCEIELKDSSLNDIVDFCKLVVLLNAAD